MEDCVARLRDGHLLCIAPGGVREALFSDPAHYNIMWARRLGFARVILGCPGTVGYLPFLLAFKMELN